MTAKEDFRESTEQMFEDVDFPVNRLMELVPHLPQGPMTKLEVDDQLVSAMELADVLGDTANFPYEELEPMIDDMVEALEESGYF